MDMGHGEVVHLRLPGEVQAPTDRAPFVQGAAPQACADGVHERDGKDVAQRAPEKGRIGGLHDLRDVG